MTHEPLQLDETLLRELLDSYTIEKGRAYQRNGRVVGVFVARDGLAVSGLVQGTSRSPYAVEITLHSDDPRGYLESGCSCPLGGACKHVAALALEVQRRGRHYVPARPNLEDVAVDAWLRDLETTAATNRSGDERVVYVIDVRNRGVTPELQIEAGVRKRLVSGEFGKPRPYSLTSMHNGTARALQPADLVIGALLRVFGLEYTTSGRPAEGPGVVLPHLIATGRCSWRSFDNPPLTAGPVRPARLRWEMNSTGSQTPAIETDAGGDLASIPVVPPWYVDLGAWQAGRLDLGLPPKVAAAILRAPPLAPSHVDKMRRVWETTIADTGTPAPLALVDEAVADRDPIPTLRLHLATVKRLRYDYSNRNYWSPQTVREDVAVASLTFDYDGQTVEPTSDLTELRNVEGGAVKRWPRRFGFERRALKRLSDAGLEQSIDRSAARPNRYMGRSGPTADDPVDLCFVDGNVAQRWAYFVDVLVPRLNAEGWCVRIDDTFPYRVVSSESPWRAEVIERDSGWFELGLELDVEGQRFALLPALVEAVRRLPKPAPGSTQEDAIRSLGTVYAALPNGAFVAVPAQRLAPMLAVLVELFDADSLTKEGRLPLSLPQAALLDDFESVVSVRAAGAARLRTFAKALREAQGIGPAPAPAGLRADLRPYQAIGLAWLRFLSTHGMGGILADDMGLGKTVETLAHLVAEKRARRLRGPSLIVAPTSVVPNWLSETHRFAPELRVLVLHGPQRSDARAGIDGADVVITSYPLLLRDAETLVGREWQIVVLDEAQAIKNPGAKVTKVARQLRARQRIVLTGTPMENHLGELWSLMSFAVPGLLGGSRQFTRLFRTPIEKHGDLQRRAVLAARVRPFLLRRTKDRVAPELPDKTEMIRRIELSGPQRDLYETVRLSVKDSVAREIERRGLARSRVAVLTALLKLRQVCCDPRLVRASSAKAGQSAKLESLYQMLPEMLEEGRRILLFSQFTSMLDLIKPDLDARKLPFVELRGETVDRATPVRRFQNGDVALFLISLKAGGTGLNLTAADTVIHYDPWWNPAVEHQATDRAHRIGQRQHVFVYKLIAAGTVEERILEMQGRKGALAESLFDPDRPSTSAFTANDVDILLSPIA